MTAGTLRYTTKKLLKAAAAAFFLCAIFLSPVFVTPLHAGAAMDALKEMAAPADIPAMPPMESAAAAPAAPVSTARALNVYFINVGQGDSEYIELPNGKNVLIDGGSDNSAGSSLARFLARHKVSKLDYVVLTHPHADHYNGLQYVFSNFTVDNFYDTRMDNPGSTTDNTLREQIRGLGVNVTYPAPGDTLDWDPGEVQAKVFNSCPASVQSSSGSVINDCSIVVKVAYQNSSVLFTGDMQDDVEAALVSKYGSELQADVLKVGHHGSRYSSSAPFLAAVKPHDAYIEVGADNSYGFPTPACLTRLQAVGATVHRTDTDGTRKYSIGGYHSRAGQDTGFER